MQFLEDGGSLQISPFYKLIKLPDIVILLWSRISTIHSQLQHPTAIMCSALSGHSHTIISKTAGLVSHISAFQLLFSALWLVLSVPDRNSRRVEIEFLSAVSPCALVSSNTLKHLVLFFFPPSSLLKIHQHHLQLQQLLKLSLKWASTSSMQGYLDSKIPGELSSLPGCTFMKTCTWTYFKSTKAVSSCYFYMLQVLSLSVTMYFLLETSKRVLISASWALIIKKLQSSTLHCLSCPADMLEKKSAC